MERIPDESAVHEDATGLPVPKQSIAALLPPSTSITPSKTTRSLSDSLPVLSPLAPSPIKEPARKQTDEDVLIATPTRSLRRESPHIRALSLQMPPRDPNFGQQESREFTSPSSILPRHSRGLDFARAATNLHHSTLVDQSSPDSSPTITQKPPPVASRRGSTVSMAMDSPRPSFGNAAGDRVLFPRSVVSTNALTSEASSSSSEEEEDDYMRLDESDEAMVMTPYMRRPGGGQVVTPFNGPKSTQSAPLGNSPFTPTAGEKESRWTMRRSKRNSGTLPIPIDRPQRQTPTVGEDYFGPASLPRQNSLDTKTDKLHLTSSHESNEDSNFATPPATPSVVRRPVTRRSNMLPKSRNFARIRAQLQEESAPAENEVKREAEVVKQVRVNEAGVSERRFSNAFSTSPTLLPQLSSNKIEALVSSDVDALGLSATDDLPTIAADARRSSNNKEFWPHLYNSDAQTPPLPLFHSGRSSSVLSEDTRIPSPGTSTPPSQISTITSLMSEVKQDSSTGFNTPNVPSASDISRKISKRRRDEDLDGTAIKRRAVSPGMSAQNSPVLGQSPASSSGWWGGAPRLTRDRSGSTNGVEDKSTSNSSKGVPTPVLGPKRVGLQGMTDTNDGLMKMSIE